jgi:hypothetical protein
LAFHKKKNLNTIPAPIPECLKEGSFKWNDEVEKSFELIKQKVTNAPILSQPDFQKVFEVECDVSNVGIVCYS